ncbi:GNAT family N-acetyltransferase [Phenylobacterium sp. VNQ135]|uniref:GNAT family N-acetyltransferase n=1 Tax=Phenylobacterium sp. VNQ135 TaxID=3400922 RepID=UPI003C0D2962
MRHELNLTGFGFRLRPVVGADAAFILGLRTDPELGRYLHATSPRLSDQEAWIAAYEARPGDYYFIVEDVKDGAPVGTVGIYDVGAEAPAQGEWGRWLIHPRSVAAVESALLVYRMAFEQLGLGAVYCRTVADNAKVVSFHDSSGARRHGLLKDHVVLAGQAHDSVEHRVDRALWDAMRPRLDMLARRLAQT